MDALQAQGDLIEGVAPQWRVALAVTAYLEDYPARTVGLPWQSADGATREVPLLMSSRESGALNRNYINRHVWKPALVEAGMLPTRQNGMHALRHFYASVLLDAGESVRALASYLGHADPGFAQAAVISASRARKCPAISGDLRLPLLRQKARTRLSSTARPLDFPVADPLVLHEDDPAALAGESKPLRVLDPLVGGGAVDVDEGLQPQAGGTQDARDLHTAEAAIEQEVGQPRRVPDR